MTAMSLRRPPYRRTAHSGRDQMDLPAGKTCGDCKHFRRCEWLISRIAADEVCDWSPSRFVPSRESEASIAARRTAHLVTRRGERIVDPFNPVVKAPPVRRP